MKIYKAYSNQELLNKLIDSKDVINHLLDFDLDDNELLKVNKYKQLSQFEKDLLYLYSQYSVIEISKLYSVSRSHIYTKIKEINNKLQ